MFSPVASTIFAYRNAEKTKNGDVGRSVVTVGQCAGVVQEISKYDNIFAVSARSALKAYENLAKDSKVLGYAGKALKFAADNVNPLICASGAVKVAMAEDKVHAGITETMALAGMFLGEGIMKQTFNGIFNEQNVKNTAQKAADNNILKPLAEAFQNSKFAGRTAGFLKGVLFVCGSIISYAMAEKAGNFYAEDIMKKLGIERKQKVDNSKEGLNNIFAENPVQNFSKATPDSSKINQKT